MVKWSEAHEVPGMRLPMHTQTREHWLDILHFFQIRLGLYCGIGRFTGELCDALMWKDWQGRHGKEER